MSTPIDWVKVVQNTIKYIEESDPLDPKLALIFSTQRLLSVLSSSIQGWDRWISHGVLDELKDEEMKEIYEFMEKHTLGWLEFDKKWTTKWRKRKLKTKIPPRPNHLYE